MPEDVQPADSSAAVAPEASVQWLAGLLEGEGCFGQNKTRRAHPCGPYVYPQIKLAMGDHDIVQRVATSWDVQVTRQKEQRIHHIPMFVARQHGVPALVTMLAVYPLMGNRRRQKIESILSAWEHMDGGSNG